MSRCFVLGNGPSLKDAPFDRLKGEVTFATNRIALLYDQTDWRPSYFVLTSHSTYQGPWLEDAIKTIAAGVPSFIWIRLFDILPFHEYDNICWIDCHNDGVAPLEVPDEWWSNDIAKGVTKFGGSATPMAQIASYMKFDPIYFIGMDGNWRHWKDGKDPNHFYDDYGIGSHASDFRISWWNIASQLSHEFIARNCPRRVFNATPNSKIDAYPRVDLEEVLDGKHSP